MGVPTTTVLSSHQNRSQILCSHNATIGKNETPSEEIRDYSSTHSISSSLPSQIRTTLGIFGSVPTLSLLLVLFQS
jgi:hypothetical protein